VSAAPVPIVFHRMLVVLAKLRRLRLFPSIVRIARLMHFVTDHFSWGEHRGGMFVTIRAIDPNGRHVEKTWHLIAEGDCGPNIPSMAAEALVRKLLAGERIEPGARNAIHDVGLEDYERMFARHEITTGVRTTPAVEVPIFERVLGEVWHRLPDPLRAMHLANADRSAKGVASVERGGGLLARLLANIIGLPHAGNDIPLIVRFERSPTRERWTRRFGDQEFHSEMSTGRGREEHLLIERFGPFSLAMALEWDGEKLHFVIRRFRLGPLPLPLSIAPISQTHETVIDDRFHFNVGISLPLVGLLVRYRGWLVEDRDNQ
jgi:hypothetical protein